MKDNVKGPKFIGIEPVPDFDWRTWLGWPLDDPAWRWLNAVQKADGFADPEDLIELIAEHTPEKVMLFVAAYLRANLKLKNPSKRARKLWLPKPALMMAARYVDSLKQHGLPLAEAVDAVLHTIPGFLKFFTRQKLYDHCAGNTGHGQRENKRIKKFHPDRTSSLKKKRQV